MRFRIGVLVVAALAVAAGANGQQAQQAPPDQGQFYASIVDSSGKAVRNLKASDIQVIEDDKPGTVISMEPVDRPVKLSLVIDNGTGLTSEMTNVRNAVEGFIRALPDGMEVSIWSMAPRPRRVVTSTDKAKLISDAGLALTVDPGNSRFGDSFVELAESIEKDKGTFFPMIVMLGTTSPERSDVKSTGLNKVLPIYRAHMATIDVVLVAPAATSTDARSRNYQAEVGTVFSKATGGIFKTMPNSNQLADELKSVEAQIARTSALQSHEYRIVFKRPSATGTGRIGVVTQNKDWTVLLSMDGRIQQQ